MNSKDMLIGKRVWFVNKDFQIGNGVIRSKRVNEKEIFETLVKIWAINISPLGIREVSEKVVFKTVKEAFECCIKLCDEEEKRLLDKGLLDKVKVVVKIRNSALCAINKMNKEGVYNGK
jgi:hypothetical protein